MLRALPLLAACTLLLGCFVFDEIDAGRDMMEKNSPQGAKKAAEAPAEEEAKRPSGSEWWSSAKSLERRDAEADDTGDPTQLVSCRIAGATRFMRRGDCLSQGGAPKG